MVDVAEDPTTSATVAVGGFYNGSLEVSGDRDWVAVTLEAGVSYAISLTGHGGTPLTDTVVYLYDFGGTQIGTDDDGGEGTFSLLSFTPATSGTYFIGASDFGDNASGGYQIAVAEVAPPSFLDSIDWGTQLDGNVIDVYFAPAGETVDGKTSLGWNAYEIQQTMLALQQIANVCDVHFNVTNNINNAEFVVGTKNSNTYLGYFNPPGVNGEGTGIFVPNGQGWDEQGGGGLEQGGYGFITLIHEFGHGMGMAHPHDGGGTSTTWEGVTGPFDSLGTFDLNQGIYTVMTYNDGWQTNPDGQTPSLDYGYEGTMMAFDIAMLQSKYGANTSFHDGATVYEMATANQSGTFFSCIWDTGGIDEISYGGADSATIDLRTATLDYSATAGGYISHAAGIWGGYTIANGVVIENATGGSGDDMIIGNNVANVLNGGNGGDGLLGGNGRDTIGGGGGNDMVIGGAGRDALNGGGGADDFIYLSATETGTTNATRDQIAGFTSGLDDVDLRDIDAKTGGTADDAFHWIGHRAFSGAQGELRWVVSGANVVVSGDIDGNGAADFSIAFNGIASLVKGDFLL